MSSLQVQLGGNTVSVQVMSSGIGAALEINRTAAADAAAAEAAAEAAAASAASAAATLAGAALKAANLSDLGSASSARINIAAVGTAALAASTGADLVGVTQGGTGSVTRALQSKLRDKAHAHDFGVVADGTTPDRVALQAAIDAFGDLGGELALAKGRVLVDEGSDDACLVVTDGVSLLGDGLYFSIMPAVGVASDVSTVLYKPSGPAETGWARFQNFTLGNYENGTRTGGVGFHIKTDQPGGFHADRILIEGVYVNPGSGLAFVHENDTTANPNGGLFCSEFRRNAWRGGMKFLNTGDSLFFSTQTTTGHSIGVEFQGVTDAAGNGPSGATFLNHNSTSELGAFLFHRVKQPVIVGANIEQTVEFVGGVSVDFKGDTKPNNSTGVWAPWLTSSLISGFSDAGLASLVNLGSVSGGVIWNNPLLDGGGAATADITIQSGTHDAWVGPNLSFLPDLRITDNGVGTRGTNRFPTYSNGWHDIGGDVEVVSYTKSLDGWVLITGACIGGTTTPGTLMFTLAPGFRPTGNLRPTVTVDDGGSYVEKGTLRIAPDGQVTITYVPTVAGAGVQGIHFAIVFRAAHANTITIPTPFVV